ncbi:hypothetical protein ACLSU7_13090 [Bdellovibrio sp. HCB185ZH]|uniref:hypothetical protein n=1 Tax=Bdellovibrio sp. HCB185ZH TaxID=3394235 RepID=UPI0039A62E23
MKKYLNPKKNLREERSTISIRRHGIAIHSHFAKMIGLKTGTQVSIYLDRESYRISLEIHSKDRFVAGAYTVCADGGGVSKSKNGKLIQCTSMLKSEKWLYKIATSLDVRDRTFSISKYQNKWMSSLTPAFEHSVERSAKIQNGSGIYRYRNASNEIVYVGRGNIGDRKSSYERKDWDFTKIEFSILNNKTSEIEYESYWLSKHQSQFGTLPAYNRIRGVNSEKILPKI